MSDHTCHAKGCTVKVPPARLMCYKHWRMVPQVIRRKVWNAYVPGQEISKTPSNKYLVVAREAIDHVAKLEGKL